MTKDRGRTVKQLLRYNVIVAMLLSALSFWTAFQLAMINPVTAGGAWLAAIIAIWNVLIAVGLSKLAYDVYDSQQG